MKITFREGKTVLLDPPKKKPASKKSVEPKDKKEREGGS